MTPRPDLNKLAKEVFEANKAKGFHDEERSNETLLMLVITKLSEAVEADRKGKRADKVNFLMNIECSFLSYKDAFETYIKDTIEDELADAVIRLLDLAGLIEITILSENFKFYDINSPEFIEVFKPRSVAETIYHLLELIMYEKFFMGEKISEGIAFIEALCRLKNIDLWFHVELKLKYNATRPHKHGKKY